MTVNPNANQIVAKELSEAMGKCKQKGVDEQSLRTGLLTITIANFINRIGMQNTLSLFASLPEHISSGIFDKYIDPATNGSAHAQAAPVAANPIPVQQPMQAQHAGVATASPAGAQQQGYQHGTLPQNFVQPNAAPPVAEAAIQPGVQTLVQPVSSAHHPAVRPADDVRRRLMD